MKKVIGVVPKGFLFDMEKPANSDVFHLVNTYIKRVDEAGAIPMCLAPVDGRVTQEQLELCDGFIVQGGNKMWPYHFQVIHHAVTTGKPYLGICLGMQLIGRYYYLRKIVEERGMEGSVIDNIVKLYFAEKVGREVLGPNAGHNNDAPGLMTRESTEGVKHEANVVPGTTLHRLLGKQQVRGASFHSWRVEKIAEGLTVNAWSADGTDTVEGLENGSNILGVQFHPEVDDMLPELFKFLTEE